MINETASYPIEVIIAITSAFAAVVSAIYAWRAFIISKEALRISQLDFKERHGDIRSYLIDSMTWMLPSGDRHYSAMCQFSNASTAPITISNIELVLHIYASSGNATKFKIGPVQVDVKLPSNVSQLNGQINLEPRTTISGWLTFKIPKPLVSARF